MLPISPMHDDRLTDLESTVTFQEKLLQELSTEIHRQQGEIDQLKAQLAHLIEQQKSTQQQTEPPLTLEEERPPHY